MKDEIVFGNLVTIKILRIMQVIVLAGIFFMKPQASESTASWLVFIPIALAEFILWRVVFARLTDSGIEYLRWGKWRIALWDDIKSVKMQPLTGLISVRIGGRPFWNQHLLLGRSNPSFEAADTKNEGALRLRKLIVR